ADGRGEQINLAVTIEVSRPDGPRLRHLVVDDVSGPLAIPTVLTGVLVPGDEPAGIARDRRVQIAVAIQIGQHHVVSPRAFRGNDIALPRATGGPVVIGEPEHMAVAVVDDGHVRLAVAVNVADRVPLEPARLILGNDVPLEVSLAIVLEPEERRFRRLTAD